MSWATPELESQPPMSLVVTCLNGKVSYASSQGQWTATVEPAKGSKVEAKKQSAKSTGIELECGYFVKAIEAVKAGREPTKEEDFGRPEGALWDVALIQALLHSNGEKVDVQGLIDQYKKA